MKIEAKICECGSLMYEDRYVAPQKKGCPMCDPDLGDTPEIRLHNYKMLISIPVPENLIKIFL